MHNELCYVPHAEDPNGALWSWEGKLDLIVLHCDPGVERTFMVHTGVHLNPGLNKFWDIYSHLSDKFDSDGGLEHQLILQKKREENMTYVCHN